MGYLTIILAITGLVTLLMVLIVSLTYWQSRLNPRLLDNQIIESKKPLRKKDFSVEILNGELIGQEDDIKLLKSFGGPGHIIIYSGQLVATTQFGIVKRMLSTGLHKLMPGEKVHVILPLAPQQGELDLENILTADRIQLRVKISYIVQLESTEETLKRLGDTVANDKIVGDEYYQCFEQVAKKVAVKVPNILNTIEKKIASVLSDLLMATDFDQLFESDYDDNLHVQSENQKIVKIENLILAKINNLLFEFGFVLREIDISQLDFPQEIKDRNVEQMTLIMNARMEKMQAELQVSTDHERSRLKSLVTVSEAESISQATAFQSQAIIRLAQAEAQAMIFRNRAIIEYYRQAIQTLKEEGTTEALITSVLEKSIPYTFQTSFLSDKVQQQALTIKNGSHK